MVYLDGTHSSWLGVGEAAYRLVKAGVQRAQGFFLNVSNYQPNDQLAQFGTWVSDCITAATARRGLGRGTLRLVPEPVRSRARLRRQLRARVRRDRDRRARQHDGRRRGDDALRARYRPQRPGAVAPDGRVSGRTGLVQPARPWRRLAPDRQRPACRCRRLPLDQDPGRIGRLVQSRDRGLDDRIPSGAASWILPPAGGSPRRRWSSPVWPHRRCSSRENRRAGRAVDAGRRKWLACLGALPEPTAHPYMGSFSGAAGIQGLRELSMRSKVLSGLCIAAACTSLGACAGVKPCRRIGTGGTGGNDASVAPPAPGRLPLVRHRDAPTSRSPRSTRSAVTASAARMKRATTATPWATTAAPPTA